MTLSLFLALILALIREYFVGLTHSFESLTFTLCHFIHCKHLQLCALINTTPAHILEGHHGTLAVQYPRSNSEF